MFCDADSFLHVGMGWMVDFADIHWLRWMEQGTDKAADGLGLCILFCIAEGA
jgi:hypothetical protein